MTAGPAAARVAQTHVPLSVTLRALVAACSVSARAKFAFRTSTVVGVIATILQVVLVFAVWTAVYGARTEVAGVDQGRAITYAVLAVAISTVFQPFVFDTLYSRIRNGAVLFDVTRPVSAVPVTLAQNLGTSLSESPAALAGLVVALVIGAVAAPGDLVTGLAFAVSLALGYAIATITNFTVGLVGFWSTEVGAAFLIYRMLAMFSSGAMIPLWFMPDWLRTTVTFLPFAGQVFVPLSVFTDPSPGWHTLGSIGYQALWVLVLMGICALVWRRALRRLVVFGG